MSDELPKGWTTAALAQLTETPKQDIVSGPFGSNLKSDEYVEAGVPIIRLQNVDRNRFLEKNMRFITPQKARELSAHTFQTGDIVITKLGAPLGKACVIPESLAHGIVVADVVRVRIDESRFSKSYVLFAINSPAVANQINSEMMGSTRPRVNLNNIRSLEIPLAPLVEQRRIVAKLEKLLDQVDSCQERLAKIPTLLKRFRQAILASACSGRLTADWRVENPNLESGAALLARINEARLKTAVSTKEKKQIVEPLQEGRLALDEDELGFDSIPDSWFACRIGAIGTVVNGSTPSREQEKFWNGKIPWVSSGEVRNNIISSTRERITKAGFEGCSVRLLSRGTVLLAMIGEGKTRGQSAILQIEATINQNIAAILISHGLISSEFLWRWFQLQYEATRERGSGSGPQALNCQRVRELPFVLPPLAEQQEIARRVENLFALADRIEARFVEGRRRVDSITQAILAKAFRGELVPTEFELAKAEGRSFEAAEELLERIRQNGDPRKKLQEASQTTRAKETLLKKNRHLQKAFRREL